MEKSALPERSVAIKFCSMPSAIAPRAMIVAIPKLIPRIAKRLRTRWRQRFLKINCAKDISEVEVELGLGEDPLPKRHGHAAIESARVPHRCRQRALAAFECRSARLPQPVLALQSYLPRDSAQGLLSRVPVSSELRSSRLSDRSSAGSHEARPLSSTVWLRSRSPMVICQKRSALVFQRAWGVHSSDRRARGRSVCLAPKVGWVRCPAPIPLRRAAQAAG
jgi:hypothetical protein